MLYQSAFPPAVSVIHFHSAPETIRSKIKVNTIFSFNSSELLEDPEKLILICLSYEESVSYLTLMEKCFNV